MLLKCKDWTKFRRKQRPQKYPNCQVMAIFARSPKTRIFIFLMVFAGSPKTRIFCKSAKGGPRKIFQKSPKKKPSFERPKSTLAQMALSSNLYAFKVQTLENILAQTAAPNVPEWPSYGNFRKVTQNLHFRKKSKGETKRNF